MKHWKGTSIILFMIWIRKFQKLINFLRLNETPQSLLLFLIYLIKQEKPLLLVELVQDSQLKVIICLILMNNKSILTPWNLSIINNTKGLKRKKFLIRETLIAFKPIIIILKRNSTKRKRSSTLSLLLPRKYIRRDSLLFQLRKIQWLFKN